MKRRTFIIKLIHASLGFSCLAGLRPLFAADKSIAKEHEDELVIVNGWIVRRSLAVKHMRNNTHDL